MTRSNTITGHYCRSLRILKDLLLREDLNQNSLKAVEIWTLVYIELSMLPVKTKKTSQLTAISNKI